MATITLQYSRDGGRNWSNERERDIGATGEYQKRVRFLRLGQHRQVVLRMRIADPVKADILGAVARIEPADS